MINLLNKALWPSGGGAPAPVLQEKTVTPDAAGFTVNPDEGYDGLSAVEVNGDENLAPGNVKKDVTIFGVTGTLEPAPPGPEPEPVPAYDGKLHLFVTLGENNLQLNLKVQGSSAQYGGPLRVNWGDGTEEDSATTFTTLSHTYQNPGDYDIAISGRTGINASSSADYIFGSAEMARTLKRVVVPKGGTLPETAGSYLFQYCINLTEVVTNSQGGQVYAFFPTEYMFRGCYNLKRIPVLSNLTSNGAFTNCYGLEEVTFASTVTNMSATGVFAGCYYLKTVTVLAATPPTLASQAFGDINMRQGRFKILVPAGSLEAYKTATNWNYYASIIEAIPE